MLSASPTSSVDNLSQDAEMGWVCCSRDDAVAAKNIDTACYTVYIILIFAVFIFGVYVAAIDFDYRKDSLF